MARLPSARPLEHQPIRLLCASGSLRPAATENFRKKFGVKPIPCYHSAETGTVSVDTDAQGGAGSVGVALPGVEIKITSQSTNKEVATGRKGVLWVRSPAASPLRLRPLPVGGVEAAVGARDADGWYRTGDLVTMDKTGRLTLKGREDDVVRVDGRRVALGEVEGCIESMPRVTAAQAKVITDPLGGPMVVARVAIKGKARLDPEAIIDHCAKNLSPYKVPRRVEICDAL
jgi:long-chain acyl-CoA synthetase